MQRLPWEKLDRPVKVENYRIGILNGKSGFDYRSPNRGIKTYPGLDLSYQAKFEIAMLNSILRLWA